MVPINIYSQEATHYFKLSKVIKAGIEDVNVSGGQFITISNYYCYDSDINGKDVGNGTLYRQKNNPSGIKIYGGDSYYGNVLYKFKEDLSVLNIEINRSLIYVYRRTIPPAAVTTCSLIKTRVNDVNTNGTTYVPPVPIQSYVQPPGGVISNQQSSTCTYQPPKTKVRKQCPYCNGKGEIIRNDYSTPTFGMNGPKKYCSKCNKYFAFGTVHNHQQCSHCHGTGYIEYDY